MEPMLGSRGFIFYYWLIYIFRGVFYLSLLAVGIFLILAQPKTRKH